MHEDLLILLPLKGWLDDVALSPSETGHLLLDLLVHMGHSWDLASLPSEMSLEDGVVDGDEEGESIADERPLVGVPPHGWVSCLNHDDYY